MSERLTAAGHGCRFHLADGLCFTRVDGTNGDDAIRIDRISGSDPLASPVTAEQHVCTVSLSAFASVIAHLGFDGETHETWLRALNALRGKP